MFDAKNSTEKIVRLFIIIKPDKVELVEFMENKWGERVILNKIFVIHINNFFFLKYFVKNKIRNNEIRYGIV